MTNTTNPDIEDTKKRQEQVHGFVDRLLQFIEDDPEQDMLNVLSALVPIAAGIAADHGVNPITCVQSFMRYYNQAVANRAQESGS